MQIDILPYSSNLFNPDFGFPCSFAFSPSLFYRMKMQHNGKRALLTALQANKTPKFRPSLLRVSKSNVQLAVTICCNSHALPQ
jgi:hypothetical protein